MTNNPRYTLGTEANRIFMASETYELLKFGKGFPAPNGGSGWLNADGTLDPSHGVETWITSRMAHVYSIGAMLGYPGAGELADAVNRASEQLRRRKEIIARRDDARTNWIAGVSHDVRTPLALILGWAEQLEQDAALPAAVRQKAGNIRTQSEKLRALIEDLNLTSKLQYGAQPLRRQPVQAGPLLRRLAAEFCESPLAVGCDMAVELSPDADKAVLHADAALLGRAVENLLNNAARHNAPGVHITLAAALRENALELTVADDGAGYPAAVLHALQTGETGANTPHILGLHVVEQIAQAHGGSVQFMQNAPQGAKAVVTLPTENQAHR